MKGMNDSYPVKITYSRDDDVYVAEFPDLPGCFAPGPSVDEAYRRALEAKDEWIRIAKEQGLDIPAPSKAEEYGGRILLRLPSSLHGVLANKAKDQGTSLNQYLVHLLSGAVMGDVVIGYLDKLAARTTSLERQLASLSRELTTSYSEITGQLAGGLSPATTQKTGGAYETLGGTAGPGPWIH
jgi:antitoxin HicB